MPADGQMGFNSAFKVLMQIKQPRMCKQHIPYLLQCKATHLPGNFQEQLELTKPLSLICCRPDICGCCMYSLHSVIRLEMPVLKR